MLTRYRHLGDIPTGTYSDWFAGVQANLQVLYGDAWRTHGGPTILPSNVPSSVLAYAGKPAARYDNDTYAALFNSGNIDPNAIQVASANGQIVYVVAPSSAWPGGPDLTTMSAVQRAENAIFTAGDAAAGAVGLPTLASIEGMLKGVGKDVLIGVAISVAAALVIKRLTK